MAGPTAAWRGLGAVAGVWALLEAAVPFCRGARRVKADLLRAHRTSVSCYRGVSWGLSRGRAARGVGRGTRVGEGTAVDRCCYKTKQASAGIVAIVQVA